MTQIMQVANPMWYSDTFVFREHKDFGTVYIKVNGKGKIEDAYDVETSAAYSKTATTTSRRKESEIRVTLEDAIDYAVETYRKSLCDDWGFDVQDDGKIVLRKTKN